jgi:LacI family transcriptional regulator
MTQQTKSQISMREFSRKVGVSTSTVSRVFSRPDLVNAGTRDRVLKLAARTGFRPSPVTRAAIGKSTRSIGILLPALSVSYFAELAEGAQTALLDKDFLPVILSDQDKGGLRGVQRMVDHRVDALIFGVSDEAIRQPEIMAITGPDFPFVLVDQPHPGFEYDCVLNDDDGGGLQAGRHLAELGHRRVACLHYGEGTANCEARIAGCRRALEEAGGTIRAEDTVQALARGTPDAHRRAIRADIERILKQHPRPTAFFATTDLFARDVLLVARDLGIRVPDELSVVGFADLGFAELLDPPLTTVRQNGEALGRTAAELILSRLEEPTRECRRVTIPTRLIVRGTSGRAGK